ncbi:OLC1v1012771C1 [Oldenlandia corymbosa var. corymbosa]|uniref:OLC1v1012771C1 n=1 Tax=Oldenlandia corymbosa var. corymbosa TaxID=529605 RepID=A0AAV1DZX5_OLDCO|nr:OLC1v1012771C1 [Oldenlandia corymbosa var. corymbosa]
MAAPPAEETNQHFHQASEDEGSFYLSHSQFHADSPSLLQRVSFGTNLHASFYAIPETPPDYLIDNFDVDMDDNFIMTSIFIPNVPDFPQSEINSPDTVLDNVVFNQFPESATSQRQRDDMYYGSADTSDLSDDGLFPNHTVGPLKGKSRGVEKRRSHRKNSKAAPMSNLSELLSDSSSSVSSYYMPVRKARSTDEITTLHLDSTMKKTNNSGKPKHQGGWRMKIDSFDDLDSTEDETGKDEEKVNRKRHSDDSEEKQERVLKNKKFSQMMTVDWHTVSLNARF